MKNKVLIGIIIVLVGVIIVEGVYLFTSKEEKKENNSYINIPKEEEEETPSTRIKIEKSVNSPSSRLFIGGSGLRIK